MPYRTHIIAYSSTVPREICSGLSRTTDFPPGYELSSTLPSSFGLVLERLALAFLPLLCLAPCRPGGLEERKDGRELRAFLFGRHGLDENARRGERERSREIETLSAFLSGTRSCRRALRDRGERSSTLHDRVSVGLSSRIVSSSPFVKPIATRDQSANGVPDRCLVTEWEVVPCLVTLSPMFGMYTASPQLHCGQSYHCTRMGTVQLYLRRRHRSLFDKKESTNDAGGSPSWATWRVSQKACAKVPYH